MGSRRRGQQSSRGKLEKLVEIKPGQKTVTVRFSPTSGVTKVPGKKRTVHSLPHSELIEKVSGTTSSKFTRGRRQTEGIKGLASAQEWITSVTALPRVEGALSYDEAVSARIKRDLTD